MKRLRFAASVTAGLIGLQIFSITRAHADFSIEQVHQSLDVDWPIGLVVPPDGSGREFLIAQRGKILILPEDRSSGQAEVVLDISDREFEKDGRKHFWEEGLLGLAFHPKFADNRKLYISYTLQHPKRSVLSEMLVGQDGKIDPDSERVLIEVPQPYWNHNSGNLVFGPNDGLLYWSLGDGGKKNDIAQLAQNRFALNGSIVRIDVDRKDGAREYGIPPENPFFGKEGLREEIYAYGLRNPWGIAFDKTTGLLWCADVGQDLWEEVNVIQAGGNYGWSFREGVVDFQGRRYDKPDEVETIDPVHVYGRNAGLSITGGFVYRGKAHPDLVGNYLFGDFITGRLWALPVNAGGTATGDAKLLYDPGERNKFKVAAISETASGEILICDWTAGKLWTLTETK